MLQINLPMKCMVVRTMLSTNDRIYDLEKKFTYPKRATIGKRSKENPDMFRPNQNFLIHFPNAEMPILISRAHEEAFCVLVL